MQALNIQLQWLTNVFLKHQGFPLFIYFCLLNPLNYLLEDISILSLM